jgi:malonate-semialdehyde dehydrogenase (acetylating)/methylmalonate-semialdehyde dehydrogenase
MKYSPLHNFISGELLTDTVSVIEVISPSDGTVLSTVPLSNYEAVNKAVNGAEKAFPMWSSIPIKERAQIFYKYKTLLEKHIDELSLLVQEENGKTLSEARAEIEKSIEVTEYACAMPQIISGEVLEVSKGVECRIEHFPLGVVASITPFNFPNMVPNWTIPNALVLGNTMILKPSEQVPLSANRIADLLKEAGLPDGVFNVVHGAREVVEAICDHPGIKAVSFVGSTHVAKIVYKRATSNLKRALTLGGAKNHLFVLPDANVQMTASNVAASMSGCAGQRCMAVSAMVAVGPVDNVINQLVIEAKKIIPGKNLGSVISRSAKERIENYISEAVNEGAVLLLDGRNCKVVGKENGFYVGPTILDHVKPDMKIASEEVFGPVLAIIRSDSLENALKIQQSSLYGNAASVFTQSGGIAKYIMENASAGMIGVNIGVPVPREPFSFGGWNESKFGVCDITGKSSIEFWTKLKKTTVKWNPESKTNWMS